MTDITIPKEALEAGRRAFANAGTADDDRAPFAEACLAMLKNWPGMIWHPQGQYRKKFGVTHLILPLPQEASDE